MKTADVVKAPEQYDLTDKFGVFLAGSIEMGKAKDWQTELTQSLNDNEDVVIYQFLMTPIRM